MQFATGGLESMLLWGGSSLYLIAALLHLRNVRDGRPGIAGVLASLGLGAFALGVAIALRWIRVGYGPFLTLHEVILSNLFSMGSIYTIVYWRFRTARPGAMILLPVLLVFCAWALATSADSSHLPPTFDNPWLWLHVGTGKVFLAACLVSTSTAGFLLLRAPLRGTRLLSSFFADDDDADLLDEVAWRFLTFAFVFHSMMLLTGAIWARDAWGRYWAWDPLETWAFFTWLLMATVLHARVTFRLPISLGRWGMISIFVLAVLTFFGVPFASIAPHKGVM